MVKLIGLVAGTNSALSRLTRKLKLPLGVKLSFPVKAKVAAVLFVIGGGC